MATGLTQRTIEGLKNLGRTTVSKNETATEEKRLQNMVDSVMENMKCAMPLPEAAHENLVDRVQWFINDREEREREIAKLLDRITENEKMLVVMRNVSDDMNNTLTESLKRESQIAERLESTGKIVEALTLDLSAETAKRKSLARCAEEFISLLKDAR